ncbi:hypothetical protein AWC29_01210 [Mycobacterium triplex]|uniref:HipA-like C-terminal domain-containing protein n=3 Tax=Mycobacterium TaxID=1763 RepID=A0A024K5X6_9MYCO|nr:MULTISPECIES: hypothetical protein [Mycobacterium]ORA14415.1 hypothetical protein BST14_13780 [Mycobacterium arosiense ATCC BAA-1401 = DSM 45069]ORJ52481.1 hypothetical protein B5M45_31200 [Mycobacterium simiae]MCA2272548.1 hypothetical protein [Mycobacterium intracellulare]MCA2324713.1 hypothetical protein [Mycobacterium intracellulare]OBH48426.1 hypothetical protein A5690_14590 [Mycobacterium intracellulare]
MLVAGVVDPARSYGCLRWVVAFTVVDLAGAGWVRGEREPGGDESKRWFIPPERSPYAGREWLFKPRRTKELLLSTQRQQRGDTPDVLVRGDDWAEKISFELAHLMTVPAATTELALSVQLSDHRPVRGSISRDVRPSGWVLSAGASRLEEFDDAFDADTGHGHTMDAIAQALAGLSGPPETPYEAWPAFDVFVGYLVLDAWIVNTDRHAYNWALVQAPSGVMRLAHSFDHGSALGSGYGEALHARALEEGIETWSRRGKASRFPDSGPLTLVELGLHALQAASPPARAHWMRQISQVSDHACEDIVQSIPDMSEVTRRFVTEVLAVNRRRLIDGA